MIKFLKEFPFIIISFIDRPNYYSKITHFGEVIWLLKSGYTYQIIWEYLIDELINLKRLLNNYRLC